MKKTALIITAVFLISASLLISCSPEVPQTKGDYTLVWNDEFDYEGEPNTEKWYYDTGSHGWGNAEVQNYTMDRKNSYVKKGKLHIVATRESKRRWNSARLVTRKRQSWLYGRIEVRAKIPEGVGTWPAIWMLPEKEEYGNWPRSGEIDLMEHVGFEQDVIHTTVHTFSYNHRLGTQKSRYEPLKGASDKFHIYAIEWTEETILFYIDDELYFEFPNEGTGSAEWPFDKPFYLILNVAIGGSWGGQQGIDKELQEADMVIDYVRVYQKQK